MRPRPCSVACKSSPKSAAIKTFEPGHATAQRYCHPSRSPHPIRIRGEEVVVRVSSARLYVCAHQTKRFIVAIKYAEEETYRYLIASDLSWRMLDIVQGHSLRWLVEVFIQD